MNQKDKDLYKIAYLEKRCPECGNTVKEIDKDTSTGRLSKSIPQTGGVLPFWVLLSLPWS